MAGTSVREMVVQTLISIFDGATNGSNQQLGAIEALGRVGGSAAATKLVSIYKGSPRGSKRQLAAIKALGEVGRTP